MTPGPLPDHLYHHDFAAPAAWETTGIPKVGHSRPALSNQTAPAGCLYESYFASLKVYVSAIPQEVSQLTSAVFAKLATIGAKNQQAYPLILRRIAIITLHSCWGSFVTLPRLKDPVTGPQPFLPVRLGFPSLTVGASSPPPAPVSISKSASPFQTHGGVV
jgi:hypothetical protein